MTGVFEVKLSGYKTIPNSQKYAFYMKKSLENDQEKQPKKISPTICP